jgi:hypothetical protein
LILLKESDSCLEQSWFEPDGCALVDRFVEDYGESNLGEKTVAQIKWQLSAHIVSEFGARQSSNFAARCEPLAC